MCVNLLAGKTKRDRTNGRYSFARQTGANSDAVGSASKDGTYYCAVFVNAQPTQVEGLGEIPLTLTVDAVGTAGEGEPDYLDEPASSKKANKDSSEDASTDNTWALFAGIAAAVAILLALAWAYLQRMRNATR